jgi:hypothetical protein
MPEFLKGVYPVGSITKIKYDVALLLVDQEGNDYYAGGIGATISADGLSQSVVNNKSNNRSSLLSNIVTLSVNGIVDTNGPTEILDGLMPPGPFYINWAIDLDSGYYEATLVFDVDTGDTVKYSWNFCIVP